MQRKWLIMGIAGLGFVTGVLFFGGFFYKTSQSLPSVEVREYQGVKLSSSADFRENSIKGPQQVDIATYKLVVSGLLPKSKLYNYRQLLAFPAYRKAVKLDCVEGWSVEVLWEGFLVSDLLKDAKVDPQGKVVIFYAVDGYSTSLPLEYIQNQNILLAYKMNGVTLRPERGFPFQLVAEDKWGYKWIKWVNRIEISNNTKYRGYWEQEGYSNDGDRQKNFFD